MLPAKLPWRGRGWSKADLTAEENAFRVQLKGLIPVTGRAVLGRMVLVHAGVVDGNVQPSKLLYYCCYHPATAN